MVQKAIVEHEFFKDNSQMLKRESARIERARNLEESSS